MRRLTAERRSKQGFQREKKKGERKREYEKETILSSSPWFLLINLAAGTAWFLLYEKRLARCSRKIPARLVEIALVFFFSYLTGSASHRLFIAINSLNHLYIWFINIYFILLIFYFPSFSFRILFDMPRHIVM